MNAAEKSSMETALNDLLVAIGKDFTAWTNRCKDSMGMNEARAEARSKEFFEDLSISYGSKYAKIISDNSAWGFVVITEKDKKFAYGDILKAASWSTPARNAARGNVFTGYEIRWTGPNYL